MSITEINKNTLINNEIRSSEEMKNREDGLRVLFIRTREWGRILYQIRPPHSWGKWTDRFRDGPVSAQPCVEIIWWHYHFFWLVM